MAPAVGRIKSLFVQDSMATLAPSLSRARQVVTSLRHLFEKMLAKQNEALVSVFVSDYVH